MNRRTISVIALGSGLFAAAAFAPAARAGTVAWGISVGGPGFGVSAGQPGFYGGRGFVHAPYYPVVRPNFRPLLRGPVILPPVSYAPMVYPLFAPAPVVFAPRPFYGYRY
jgi:hypothetical protein